MHSRHFRRCMYACRSCVRLTVHRVPVEPTSMNGHVAEPQGSMPPPGSGIRPPNLYLTNTPSGNQATTALHGRRDASPEGRCAKEGWSTFRLQTAHPVAATLGGGSPLHPSRKAAGVGIEVLATHRTPFGSSTLAAARGDLASSAFSARRQGSRPGVNVDW